MRRSALLFPAIGALALLPAVSTPAGAASCRDEVQQLAQTFHLSLGPTAQSSAPPSRGAPAGSAQQLGGADWSKLQGMMSQGQTGSGQGAGRTAEAPATTESRGIAGPDSLESSGGTLPPSTTAPAQRSGAAPTPQLGAADRAKAEALLSEAQAADAQGNGDQCRQILRAAQAMLLKGRQ
jgi:hypothetical protein